MSLSNSDLVTIKSFLEENPVFILNKLLQEDRLSKEHRSIIKFFTSESTQRIRENDTWGDFAQNYATHDQNNRTLRKLLGAALGIQGTSLENLRKINVDIKTVRQLAGVTQEQLDPSVEACYLAKSGNYQQMCRLYGPATTAAADNESLQKGSILQMGWTINGVTNLGPVFTDFLSKFLPELEGKTKNEAIIRAVDSLSGYEKSTVTRTIKNGLRNLDKLLPDIPQDKDKVYTAAELANSLLKALKIPEDGYSMIKALEMITPQNQINR